MTDRGSFRVQSEALRRAATMWRTAAGDMGAAGEKIAPGVGMGSYFGVLAGSSGVSGHYDQWSREMATAIAKAQANFEYLDAALNSVANDYDGVDATVVSDISTLDRMIEE